MFKTFLKFVRSNTFSLLFSFSWNKHLIHSFIQCDSVNPHQWLQSPPVAPTTPGTGATE